jgi:hypothetical protein
MPSRSKRWPRAAGESCASRAHEGDLLCDEPADREPEQGDPLEAERGDERDHPPRRLGDRAARLAGRGTDARVVDQDDLALSSERVGQRWIPVVEVAAEVLEHHQR